MKGVLYQAIFAIIFSITLGSCANIVAPTGGIKDSDPPKIDICEPPNFSTLFFDNQIIIQFDEYIQLTDLGNQLIVSPPMNPEPEIRVKGKTLTIELSDSLDYNTTFVISFGDAIVDVNERNPLKNFKYVFSTGNYLDSLELRGNVRDAFTLEAKKDILVMLYDDQFDSVPMLSKPTYFTRTDASGNFAINYLRKGKFKLFALNDNNGNYIYDLPDEEIGFRSTLVNVAQGGSANKVQLLLFEEDNEQQYVLSSNFEAPGTLQLILNKPSEKPKVQFIDSSINPLEEIARGGDTLTYWFTDGPVPEKLNIVVSDSSFTDTIRISLDKSLKGDSIFTPVILDASLDLNEPLVLLFPEPIKRFESDKFMLMADSLMHPFEIRKDESLMRKLTVGVDWKETTNYSLHLFPGAVTSVFGETNDSMETTFTTKASDFYGSLNLNLILNSNNESVILQLVGSNGKKLDERIVVKSGVQRYEYLKPGTYNFKLIQDANSNGNWDSGEYLLGIQPEIVKMVQEKITVRSNWELEIEWEISSANSQD